MKSYILGLLLCLSTTMHAQLLTDSIRVEGHYRTFHYVKPPRKAASVIFVMHGSGSNPMAIRESAMKLEAMSGKENLILVYPAGYKHYWNECRKAATTPPNLENINEEAFFTAMIQLFKKKYAINERKVFAIGFSGGGHMAYKLALTMPGKVHAITAIVASLPDSTNLDCVEKKVAVPVMIVNGTNDPLNKWEGGMIVLGNNINMGRVRSTEDTFHYWSRLAGYSGGPRKDILPDTDPGDGKIIERYTYQSPGKPEVVLLKVVGGKHDLPNDVDVFVASWTFFKRAYP